MCVAYNAGDAAFAVRYALRNATAGGGDDEDDDMSRVLPMANPYARVRDFISRLVHLRRELDIVSLARTVKIQKPIIPIGGVCILRMHVYVCSKISRRPKYARPFQDHRRVLSFRDTTIH